MKNESFASLMGQFDHRYHPKRVFEDFLTLTLCAFAQNPGAGKSYDEELYLQTITPYSKDPLRFEFPTLLARLVIEMEQRLGSSSGNDVLGEYYEQNFARKKAGQIFTPWPICEFIAACTVDIPKEGVSSDTLRILDPCCGSGRLLMAGGKIHGTHNELYGIDIDHTCVKMAVLNLFLNGCFHAELLWADALSPGDFRMSYYTSFVPFGIFRLENKEQSKLWHMLKNTSDNHAPSDSSASKGKGPQLTLF